MCMCNERSKQFITINNEKCVDFVILNRQYIRTWHFGDRAHMIWGFVAWKIFIMLEYRTEQCSTQLSNYGI